MFLPKCVCLRGSAPDPAGGGGPPASQAGKRWVSPLQRAPQNCGPQGPETPRSATDNDDRVIPCTVSVWFPFDGLLPISIKYDVTPIKMLFTLMYTFYKKSISQVSKMCHYPMAFRMRPLGLDHRRPTTKFLQFYVSGHLNDWFVSTWSSSPFANIFLVAAAI